VFTCVEGAGSVIVEKPLLQFHPVAFGRWEWEFSGLGGGVSRHGQVHGELDVLLGMYVALSGGVASHALSGSVVLHVWMVSPTVGKF